MKSLKKSKNETLYSRGFKPHVTRGHDLFFEVVDMSQNRMDIDQAKMKRFFFESRVYLGVGIGSFAKICKVPASVVDQMEKDPDYEMGGATILQMLFSLEYLGIHRGSRFFLLAEEEYVNKRLKECE